MGFTSARLMGVILLLIPIVIVPLILTGRRVRGLSRASQDRIADTSSLADETLNAIQTVQAFTMEELQSERYEKAVEDSFATAVRRTKVRAALTAIGIMMVFGGITFVLWLGARQVIVRHDDAAGSSRSFCCTPPSSAPRRRPSRKCGAKSNAPPAPWSA